MLAAGVLCAAVVEAGDAKRARLRAAMSESWQQMVCRSRDRAIVKA